MALRWKWVLTIVWLLYSAMVLVELRRYFGNPCMITNWYNSSTISCKGYVLEGAASAEDLTNMKTTLDIMEWRGGEWFYPPEAFYNPNWPKQHSMPTVCYGNERHETRFSVIFLATRADDGVEWGNLTQPIRTIEGHLILQDFWNHKMYMEYMSQYIDYDDENAAQPAKGFYEIDRSQVRNLKILLLGAVVNTGVDRRVCMTGCANRSDLSNQLDCEFVLKMTYPNRRTLTTRHIEAELSSARAVNDPLYFPAFRIVGPSTVSDSEYDLMSEKLLQSALNMTGSAGNLAGLQDLATYLERSGLGIYKAILAPTVIEQTLFKRQGKVVVGPFSTPYYPDEEPGYVDLASDLDEVGLTLKFKNVVTTTSNFSGRVLVGGSMKMDMSWNRGTYNPYTLEQRPFSVEGIWDTSSDQLCMIGCLRDSLNPNPHQNDGIPGAGCDWKICIQSLLPRFVTIDSASDGAVLSSLYADAQQPGYFTPVRFMRERTEDDSNSPEQMADITLYSSAEITPLGV